jgi:hypothetical protein
LTPGLKTHADNPRNVRVHRVAYLKVLQAFSSIITGEDTYNESWGLMRSGAVRIKRDKNKLQVLLKSTFMTIWVKQSTVY